METVDEIRRTLESVEGLGSIVRTMKALAAVSIRQYERSVHALAQYSRAVDLALHVVLRDMPRPVATARRPVSGLGAVVFGSDHGLCGRFNEDLADFAAARIGALEETGRVQVLAVGARLAPRLDAVGLPADETLAVPGSAERITATVHEVLRRAEEWRADWHIEDVHLFYSRRILGARPRPAAHRLLPVGLHRFHRLEEAPWPSQVLPMFTMNRERLFAALVRQHLFIAVFRACAESQAAEHASRLAAMQAAERNLDERLAEVLMAYRRRRQEVITAELLDVVSGYEALRETPRLPFRRRIPPAVSSSRAGT